MTTDTELITSLSKGDEKAFKTFFYDYYGKVHSYSMKMTLSRWASEEITQRVFSKIWIHRTNLVNEGNLSGYLFRTTYNEVIDYFREQKRIYSIQERLVGDAMEETREEILMDQRSAIKKIDDIVNQMPFVRRQVFIMSKYRDLSNAEISKRLGISKRTVEKHLQLAMRSIRMTISSFL